MARPELVSALVVAGAPLPDHDSSDALEQFGIDAYIALERWDLDAAVEANLRMWVDGCGRDPAAIDPELRAFVGTMQRLAFERSGEVAGDGEELLVPDLGARLGEIRAPTLALAGAHDVPDMRAIAERLARASRRAPRSRGRSRSPPEPRAPGGAFDALALPFLAGADR